MAAPLIRAIEREPGPQVWRLADMVRANCARTGHIGEWVEVASALLAVTSPYEVPAVAAMLHIGMGDGLSRTGRRTEAVGHLEEAVRIAHGSGEREGEAAARMGLSFARAWTGDLTGAIADNVRAARLFEELGSVPGRVRALNALGHQHHHLGRLDLAERYCRQALTLSRRHELPYAEGALTRCTARCSPSTLRRTWSQALFSGPGRFIVAGWCGAVMAVVGLDPPPGRRNRRDAVRGCTRTSRPRPTPFPR
ncbi:tetratricopeptide repeat protein [Nonomuraea polychroma]|uniref:tetratricopeptide repeat protein n=1 Tax=Nonomuraea polychroma TaxID=46176 RepID=UPI000FDDAF3F|nr:tetratricopeptide repeat protein [Nonomuraea polychroma]